MKNRLEDTYGTGLAPYEVIGEPKDLASARALALQDRFQFEWWALGLVDARPAQDKRKGADRGVDGYIYFFDDRSGKAKTVVVQVKSGHVQASHVRDLVGVLDREKAAFGVLVTLEEPTGPMRKEAASAGFYASPQDANRSVPRVQLLTIRELVDGRQVQYPWLVPTATFKRAQRRKQEAEQKPLV